MPRDARLGFVLGVALVIVIAVVFYHRNGTAGTTGNVNTPPSSTGTGNQAKPAPKNPTPLPGVPATKGQVRSHTAKEGDTLPALALQYYGDEAQAALLFRANRSQLQTAEEVPAGTVLVVPDLASGER
jgi:nucleoid-associated protein YgaU